MYLYDGKSDVDFFYAGTMTHAEISATPALADLALVPCVLYDDGNGRVYRYERLDSLANRYGVEMDDDAENTLAAVVEVMNRSVPDIAESAKQTADEAKATADTAAASVNEYMDALLGLDTTDETEANDAE